MFYDHNEYDLPMDTYPYRTQRERRIEKRVSIGLKILVIGWFILTGFVIYAGWTGKLDALDTFLSGYGTGQASGK